GALHKSKRGQVTVLVRLTRMWVLARTFSPAISPDHIEAELTVAQRRDHEPAAQVRRIGLVVAPAAKGHQLIQVEVGAALCAFDQVVDVETTPYATGLTAPARPREDLLPNGLPLGHAGGRTAQCARRPGPPLATSALANRRPPPQHADVRRFCPRGQTAEWLSCGSPSATLAA